MNQFELAASEVDKDYYTGDSMQENVVEWVRGSKVATVNFCQGRMATRVKKLAESKPDDVQIVAENSDGSIVAHIPSSWVKINPPKQMEYTEEQLEALRERARKNLVSRR